MKMVATRGTLVFVAALVGMSTLCFPIFAQTPAPKAQAKSPATKIPVPPPAPLSDGASAADGAPNADAKQKAKEAFEHGMKLFADNLLDDALANLRQSIKLYPTRAACQNAALILKGLRRFDEATDGLEAVLRDYPQMSDDDRRFVTNEVTQIAQMLATIDVTANETDATIIVDGVERGKTPTKIRVSAGTRFVRVYKEGFLPFGQQVEVAARTTMPLTAKLGAMLQGGRLSVTEGSASKVTVVVDNVVVGKAPWEGTLPVGTHTVLLRGEGDVGSMPASVDVKLNQMAKLQLLAEPLECRLRIEPTPATALVVVDSAELGRGVWAGSVRCGGHIVELAEKGYLPFKKQVSNTKERELTVTETLERDATSDEFKAKNPPRVFVGLYGAFATGPAFGGDVGAGCTDGCSFGLAAGAVGTLRAGYRLPIGLGIGADVGYLYGRGTYEGRTQTLTGKGKTPWVGTASDRVSVYGPFLGVAASYESGESAIIGGRLGAGIISATVNDRRDFHYAYDTYRFDATVPNGLSTNFAAYVKPDVHVGLRASKRLVIEAGVEAFFLLGLGTAKWQDGGNSSVGDLARVKDCPNDPSGDKCFGGSGTYNPPNKQDSLVGNTIVLLTPFIGGRLEF